MPSSRPSFAWLGVLCSAADILARAAQIRAAQLSGLGSASSVVNRGRNVAPLATPAEDAVPVGRPLRPSQAATRERTLAFDPPAAPPRRLNAEVPESNLRVPIGTPEDASGPTIPPCDAVATAAEVTTDVLYSATIAEGSPSPRNVHSDTGQSPSEARAGLTPASKVDRVEDPGANTPPGPQVHPPAGTLAQEGPRILADSEDMPLTHLQASKVPSSRIGRLFHYGGLAASIGYGVATEVLRRSREHDAPSNPMMSEANIKRLVQKLSQMRGAALKVGQFLSIQDTHVLSPEIDKIFRRVQDSAHYMPDWQMEQVFTASLGPDWQTHFSSFTRIPFAAASIGQVHAAVLAPSHSPTGSPARVAVKVQFPNIADSIASDLGYIKLLLTAGRLLPRGLFLDRTAQVMKEELIDECDYTREAAFIRRFGSHSHLGADARFQVPWVWEGSTKRVLVMEHIEGLSVGDASVSALSQEERNDIAARVIELCLKELFEFRLMQTDPNWTNFLWNARTRRLGLVDFGATREYSKSFMDNWVRLLSAAAMDDRDGCIKWSLQLGYLTGNEDEVMLNAHVQSLMLLATPFKETTVQPFAFGPGTAWAEIAARIRANIPVMLRRRLTPPPRETLSLNRKLSGGFLLASRLGAVLNTRTLWDGVVKNYKMST